MTLLGIISDVHANSIALISVLFELRRAKVDMIISAGDIIGYNPYPNETIKLFQYFCIQSIYGNHDKAAITRDTSSFNSYAKKSMEWTINELFPQNLEYLKSLKSKKNFYIDGIKILIVHGSPHNENEYIYPENILLPNILLDNNADIIILGHTHIQFSVKFDEGIIINPGSVGQPRDRNPFAAYAIFDTKSKQFALNRVEYNLDKVIKAIKNAKLPEELGIRLKFGRGKKNHNNH
ncbi:MAG: metallophosphatase family protein [Bacteroidales bacterium]|nr:metallophosphatase family protein [Bacteroidales bacterium]